MDAINAEKTLAELAKLRDVHANQIVDRKNQLLERAASANGKGAWRDNAFVERLWRSIKHEEVYLHACDSVNAAKPGLARHINFHNTFRPHSALGTKTPGRVLLRDAVGDQPGSWSGEHEFKAARTTAPMASVGRSTAKPCT